MDWFRKLGALNKNLKKLAGIPKKQMLRSIYCPNSPAQAGML